MNNPAQKLASMRKQVKKKCPVCGTSFIALKTAKTCSSKCRQKLYRSKIYDS